jgi:hypothetical protein
MSAESTTATQTVVLEYQNKRHTLPGNAASTWDPFILYSFAVAAQCVSTYLQAV